MLTAARGRSGASPGRATTIIAGVRRVELVDRDAVVVVRSFAEQERRRLEDLVLGQDAVPVGVEGREHLVVGLAGGVVLAEGQGLPGDPLQGVREPGGGHGLRRLAWRQRPAGRPAPGRVQRRPLELRAGQLAVAVGVERLEEPGQVVAPDGLRRLPGDGDLQPHVERPAVEQQEHVAHRLGVVAGAGAGRSLAARPAATTAHAVASTASRGHQSQDSRASTHSTSSSIDRAALDQLDGPAVPGVVLVRRIDADGREDRGEEVSDARPAARRPLVPSFAGAADRLAALHAGPGQHGGPRQREVVAAGRAG